MQIERTQKDPKKRCVLTIITNNNQPKKTWDDKRTDFAGEFEKICYAEGIQVYYTKSETKVAFVEHNKRSLKKKFCRYMENYGCSTFTNCCNTSQA